jgi:hypothetical protein
MFDFLKTHRNTFHHQQTVMLHIIRCRVTVSQFSSHNKYNTILVFGGNGRFGDISKNSCHTLVTPTPGKRTLKKRSIVLSSASMSARGFSVFIVSPIKSLLVQMHMSKFQS